MSLDDVTNKDECQHLVKVIFVGDAFVGKTCIVERLFSNKFDPKTQPTIGVDFRSKDYIIDGRKVRVSLWDTAGAEKYSAMTASYYRGIHGMVLVYDVTRRQTLHDLVERWLPEARDHVDMTKVVTLIIGNKKDLESERQVTPEEGLNMARMHGCMYSETSARSEDESIHDALVWGLLSNILDSKILEEQQQEQARINLEHRQHHDFLRHHPCCIWG